MNIKGIPAFAGLWKQKTIFLDLHYPRLGIYRKRKPRKDTWHLTAEITVWQNIPPKEDLWVRISSYNNNGVVISKEQIDTLKKELDKLQKIKEEEWQLQKILAKQ